MTPSKFTELVIDYLAGGTCPADIRGKMHPLVIMEYIDMAYADILAQLPSNQLDAYVKAYNSVPVSYDSLRDEYYIDLPTAPISLAMNRGIRLISPQKEQKVKFWASDNNSASVYDELEVSTVLNKVKYYVENTRVYFRNFNTDFTSLLVKLVVPFSSFDENDEIPLPSIKKAQIFSMIVQLLRQKPPEKHTNNNNSNA